MVEPGTDTDAFTRVIDALRAAGCDLKAKSGTVRTKCPGHNGTSPDSLSVARRDDGNGAVLNCFSGCQYVDILAAIKLRPTDLFDKPKLRDAYQPTNTYTYPGGRQVNRKPNGNGGKTFWQAGNKADRSLFGSDRITADTTVVYVVEGEKDCLAAEGIGLVAVCPAQGAGTKPDKSDWTPLAGKRANIVADNDGPGLKHAQRVAEELRRLTPPADVSTFRAADGCKDLADHVAMGFGLDDLVPLTTPDDAGGGSAEKVRRPRDKRNKTPGEPESPESPEYPASPGSPKDSGTSDGGGSGTQILDDLVKWLSTYICVTRDADLIVLALWIIHTYLVYELGTTPRLLIDSSQPGSGKTTVLDHCSRLCFNPIQAASLSSPALLARLLVDGPRTILLDEVDRNLRYDKPGVEDLIAILNSGYRRGATRPVLVPVKGGGWVAEEMPTFAPVAMAGNAPNLPDDTKSREIRVLLMPDLDWEDIEEDALALKARIEAFADSVRDQVAGLKVELPQGCMGRFKEKWRPLMRVAVLAGGRWPSEVTSLIESALAEAAAEREDGLQNLPPAVTLLADLARVWPAVEDDTLVSTGTLVEAVRSRNPAYWGGTPTYPNGLTAQRFGKLVSQSARVTSVRDGNNGPRGFRRSQFIQAWVRNRIIESPDASGGRGEAGYSGNTGDTGSPTDMPSGNLFDAGVNEPLCNICGVQKLIFPESQARGRCEPCRRAAEGSTLTCSTPGCGNTLNSPEAVGAGRCRPCRDRTSNLSSTPLMTPAETAQAAIDAFFAAADGGAA